MDLPVVLRANVLKASSPNRIFLVDDKSSMSLTETLRSGSCVTGLLLEMMLLRTSLDAPVSATSSIVYWPSFCTVSPGLKETAKVLFLSI